MPEIHMLTGAYALDALEGVERAGFERHLRSCDTCTTEVAEFRQAAVGLAERAVQVPPAGLRERVLAEVATTRQVSPRRALLPRFSLRSTLAVAAAAIVIAAAAGLGGVTWQAHRAAHSAQVEAASIARVMTDPSRLEVVGTSSVGGSATVIAAGGSAVFAADQLPALPGGKTYQLWVIDGSGTRASYQSAGLLKLRDGRAQTLVDGVTPGKSLGVTVEPGGGSKQPTTTPVLNLKVA